MTTYYGAQRDGEILATGHFHTRSVNDPEYAVVAQDRTTGQYAWEGAFFNEANAQRRVRKTTTPTTIGLLCEAVPMKEH